MKRNRALFLILLGLSLIFVYFYGGKIPYMLFFTAITMPIISFLYMYIIYARFKYMQEVDKKHVIKGEKVNFNFNINNEDFFLYPYVRVILFGENTVFAKQFQAKCFSLIPLAQKSFSYELECKYRGIYEIGIDRIEIEDFLGIFKLTYKIFENRFITVYPRVIHLDRFQLKNNFISEARSLLNTGTEDMTTISDIRKYAYGDSYKRIHWKLTAKMNEFFVKNYENTSQTCATLFLDLKPGKISVENDTIIEDKLIEAIVSVVYFCLSNWIPIDLVFFNKDTIERLDANNPLHFDELYKVLAKLTFTENVEIKDILDMYLESSIKRSNFIIFTSNLNYDLFNHICKAKYSGYEVSIVYVSSEELTGEKNIEADDIISYLPEIGVSPYKINISDDIKHILEHTI